jgi:beta-glucosidase
MTIYIANTTGLGGWETALTRAQSFVDQLTTDEKFAVVTGTGG